MHILNESGVSLLFFECIRCVFFGVFELGYKSQQTYKGIIKVLFEDRMFISGNSLFSGQVNNTKEDDIFYQ